MRQSKRVRFINERKNPLAGIVEIPANRVWAWAVFTHCFTCTKDLKSIVRISRRLAEHGIGVLRYDCAGLGDSEGDFSASNFDTTCLDLQAAAQFVDTEFGPPRLLIGHSFGGAASLACGERVPSVQAIVTIAAPSDTQHLAVHIDRQNPRIAIDGEGDFSVGGQTYRLRRQLLENLKSFDLTDVLSRMTVPVLMFHSPLDETLAWDHAVRLWEAIAGTKAFVTLDGADHLLLNQQDDTTFVADLIALWLARYLVRPDR